jgi:TRAP-type mannitol/chloroaromatic compound transport system substrate-binding protein
MAAENELMGRIYASFKAYTEIVRPWTTISDQAILNMR